MNRKDKQRGSFASVDLLLGLGAVAGVLSFLLFYEGLYPWAARTMKLPRKEVSAIARATLEEQGFDLNEYRERIKMRRDDQQIRYLEQQFGTAKANRFIRTWIPAYYWEVTWSPPGRLHRIVVDGGETKVKKEVAEGQVDHLAPDEFVVRMCEDGQILSMSVKIGDEVPGAELPEEEALKLAERIMVEQLSEQRVRFDYLGSRGQRLDSRLDYTFRWEDQELAAGERVEFTVDITGDRVTGFAFSYNVPEGFAEESPIEEVLVVPTGLMFLLLIILFLVVLVHKLRADEITFRLGWFFGIIAAICLAINVVMMEYNSNLLDMVLPIAFGAPFVGLFLALAVSASDAVAREAWPDKLLTLDTLRSGRVLHDRFGKAVLRGLGIGLVALGLGTAILKGGSSLFPLYFRGGESKVAEATALVPVLYRVADVTVDVLYLQFAIVLFLVSYLAQRFAHRVWIATLVVVIWALGTSGFGQMNVSPFPVAIVAKLAIALLFVLAFFRYDFLTTLVGYFTFSLLYDGFPMVTSADSFVFANGVALLVGLGLIGVFGAVALSRKVSEGELTRYAPTYVKRINERLRMQRELEIARDVQLSFLPRTMPKIQGLDIATICIPATEVGGDYYDFVDLGENKLGIAIGDVSGKGISAAFYMTLTKGFFQSQASLLESPREVLKQINRLFYENVERSHFISMIYGVFDMSRHVFSFARAGHNPVIVRSPRRGKSEVLCPKGIALGLERGPLFDKIIEEQKVELKSGDFFILYTDGFTEAMDSKKYEFGEERLYELVENQQEILAQELTEIIVRKIKGFVGKSPQNDDMTMVVIHVL